ncbi:hypothetical protein AMP1_43 [Burkholderia phage AMP1]|uniref:Uncharacterized protein n=5 Tax=Ampunavirus BpAMP1 TaxID=2733589 RepID=A0A5C2IH83_9CAUD|nr:hypothetical protein HOQ94_gp03 [Burkholderia phage Bp-AMP1]QEP52870.1 hypothetical protein AMP1_43 [Burkholderia phage AMP1]CDL65159.1 hypothetical protein [Burkholderia phage Bp-AMP2]CDL65200.1 hypothetical protein [Burkholderia phage Bp-AMP3]CDL65240.1 hypothetical protein [Burkholderia phage Bp-AMP4]CDK30072.1 hypothetical protein [Burkholderia phage Bp-AMP1]
MNFVNLPDLRRVVRGFDLRVDAARAISHVELAKAHGSTNVDAATDLRTFFIACANHVDVVLGGTGSRVVLVAGGE